LNPPPISDEASLVNLAQKCFPLDQQTPEALAALQ
jgi:hypothetical protein